MRSGESHGHVGATAVPSSCHGAAHLHAHAHVIWMQVHFIDERGDEVESLHCHTRQLSTQALLARLEDAVCISSLQ